MDGRELEAVVESIFNPRYPLNNGGLCAKGNQTPVKKEGNIPPKAATKVVKNISYCNGVLTYEIEKTGASIPTPIRVIFNNPATIVFWGDGDKTVVKCEGDKFSEEFGFAMAFMRKIYGSRSAFKKAYNSIAKRPIAND